MTTQYTHEPEDGSIVVAKGVYKGNAHTAICIYENGKFTAGGDFPVPAYEIKDVTDWKYAADILKPFFLSEVFDD